eukprot:CAMPEP_0197179628 /NCGR_PEP_ID=MMETSP1423-20130617/4508_1 /TAXON_ID=476441 /ORGANISM="Pseudo-nitzschia heimii, Strain UNC1101" /LENGTH=214 /DNA_ID=CAMNT_0042629555 /DNA_START=88 /DNA_END=732 /DNA_ORIENTATION=-
MPRDHSRPSPSASPLWLRGETATVFLSFLAIGVLSDAGGVAAFGPPPSTTTLTTLTTTTTSGRGRPSSTTTAVSSAASDDDDDPGRRKALATLAGAALVAVGAPPRANALKKRNEALCGTGFFEHIYEYKCTEIGDIEDEGYSRSLNPEENGLTDGLMGKLGFGGDDDNDPFGEKNAGADSSKSGAKGVSYDAKNTAGGKPKARNNSGGGGGGG